MRYSRFAIPLLFLATVSAGPVFAGDAVTATDGMYLVPNIGTLGAGVKATWRLDPYWGVSAGINGGYYSYVYKTNNSDLHDHLMLLNGGVTADYYPFAGDFYLSGGARIAANKITGKMTNLHVTRSMGGNKFHVIIPDPLTTFTVTQNVVQPYIGAGYNYAVTNRINLNFDLGVLYGGTPNLDVVSHANRLGISQRKIDAEINLQQSRISGYRFYPVAQLGFKVSF